MVDCVKPIWPSKADPIFRGSKPGALMAPAPQAFQSRPDLQGVKTHRPRPRLKLPAKLPKQTRSSGGQNPSRAYAQAKTRELPKQTRSSGGQNRTNLEAHARAAQLPKQTRSSGGQNASISLLRTTDLLLPKQTRSSGGQNAKYLRESKTTGTSKADPIFRGSKPAMRKRNDE